MAQGSKITLSNNGSYTNLNDYWFTETAGDTLTVTTTPNISTGSATGTWTNSTYTYTNETELRLEALEKQNKEIMEMVAFITEDENNLKKFPALKAAYEEYMFIRKLILSGEEE